MMKIWPSLFFLIVVRCASAMALAGVEDHDYKISTEIEPNDLKISDDQSSTESGIFFKILKEGKSTLRPSKTDSVLVHYVEWTEGGRVWDSSVARGKPTLFSVKGLIRGLEEGIQLMRVGEIRRFWIPAHLAFGEKPRGGRPGGLIIFDVELLEIIGENPGIDGSAKDPKASEIK